MTDRLYTLNEYIALVRAEVRDFYELCRLAALEDPTTVNKARTIDKWDRIFDDFTAERRAERGIT